MLSLGEALLGAAVGDVVVNVNFGDSLGSGVVSDASDVVASSVGDTVGSSVATTPTGDEVIAAAGGSSV